MPPEPPWPPTLCRELSSGWCDLEPQVPHHKETGLCPLACPQLCARQTPFAVLGMLFPASLWHSDPHCQGWPPPKNLQTHPAPGIPGTEFPQHLSGITNCQIVPSHLFVSQVSIFNLRLMVRSLKAGTMLDSPSSLDEGCSHTILGTRSSYLPGQSFSQCFLLASSTGLSTAAYPWAGYQDPSPPHGLLPSLSYNPVSRSTRTWRQ